MLEFRRARATTRAARARLMPPLVSWQRRLQRHPLLLVGGGVAVGAGLGASEKHHRRVLLIMRALGRGGSQSMMRLFAYARAAAAMAQR